MKKKFLALVLTLAMVLSLVPVTALAVGENGPVGTVQSDGTNGVKVIKTATPKKNGNGEATIDMEAYVTGTVTSTTQSTPLDIVLVLDQSGSMKDSRLERLKTAATNFINTITKDATEHNVDHRIAVVGFAGKNISYSWENPESYFYANTELFVGETQYNYKEGGKQSTHNDADNLAANHYAEAFQSVTTDVGKTNLAASISNLDAYGGTHPELGMEMANGIFAANSDEIENRQRIVVMFTDGNPGDSSEGGFDKNVADATVAQAYTTKNTYHATVYTVGLISNPSDQVKNFLNKVSSNYLDAKSYAGKIDVYTEQYNVNRLKDYYVKKADGSYKKVSYYYAKESWRDGRNGTTYVPKNSADDTDTSHTQFYSLTQKYPSKTATKYYMHTGDAGELNKIFTNIAQDTTHANVEVGNTSEMRDELSNFFVFDGIERKDDGTVTKGVMVTKVAAQGSGSEPEWATTGDDITGNVTVKVVGDKITVTGFDYSSADNCVVKKTDMGWQGHKLVLSFDVKPNVNCYDWKEEKNYDTNKTTEGSQAGLYYGDNDSTVLNQSPQVPVPTYQVIYSWGDSGVTTTVTDSQYYISEQEATVNYTTVKKEDAVKGTDGQWYRFRGWSLDGETVIESVAITNSNVTLKPVLTKAYTVTYTGQGATDGTAPKDAQSPYSAGSAVTVLTEQGTLEKTGHTFAGWTTKDADVTSSTFTMPAQDVVFDPVWTVNQYTVTINYVYQDGTTAADPVSITDNYNAPYSQASPPIKGYKPDQETVSGTVPVRGTTITVTYSKDKEQIQTLTYTVRHVVDGEEMESKTYRQPVWAGETEPQIEIQEGSLAQKTYPGYKLESITDNLQEGDMVASGKVITLTYVKDESKTQTTCYTVKHVVDGVTRDEQEYTSTTWVGETEPQIEIQEGSLTPKTYPGYKLDSITDNLKEGDVVASGKVITLAYVKDNDQDQTTHYTVKHVVDGVTRDEQEYTSTTWVGETEPQIEIQEGSLAPKTYPGYKLDSITDNLKEGDVVASGTIITLTYVKDKSKTQETSYTVKHVLIPRVGAQTVYREDSYDGTDWINETNPTVEVTAESIKPLKIDGYTYRSISPENVTAGSRVSDGTIIILCYMDLNSGKCSVTYEGEAVTRSTTYHDEGAAINILKEPTQDGYLFDGWECNLDQKTYQAGVPYTVTQDVVFTAKWTPIKKEIKISKALTKVNGNDYQTGTVSIGDVLTYSVTVVNTGNVDLPSVVIHDSLVGDITFGNINKDNPTGVTKTYVYKVPADAGESVKNAVVAKDKETIEDNGGDEVTVPVAKRYTVTTSIDSHGTITPTTTYDEGKDATVSFTITGNYRINSVTVDGAAYQNYAWSNTDNAYIIKFEKIAANHTVAVTTKAPGGGGGGGGSNRPKPPVVEIPDDVPTGLNGKDHYAYVVGYPDGMVYPQKNITRAEVATIFFRLLKDETREANMTKSNSYNDMKDGAWYTCAVSTLSKMGIIKGYEDGSFKPDASISRAEFAAIAARFDPNGDKTPATFSDVSSHWAKDEISIAANHGWIKGYEDGSFKPDQKITRAETMTLVNRVLKRLPETKDDLHKDMKTWPDNQNESAWFYLAVQEATNSHYQKLKKDGTHETWESMRETRDWAALEK